MKDEFQFSEGYAGKTVTVHVKKTTIMLHDETGFITSGLWDAGGYVRYARSSEVAALVHPFLLDKIDQKCRKFIALKGTMPERVPPPGNAR